MANPTTTDSPVARWLRHGWQWLDATLHPFPKQYGPAFPKIYDELIASEWSSPVALAAYQNQRLQALIDHAYRRVPYYREVMDARKIKPRDIRAVADLAKLPILTKAIIRERSADLIARGAEKDFWIESHTSGSTGQPLTFLLDAESNIREVAFRSRSWTFGSYRLGDRAVLLRSFVPKPGEKPYFLDRRHNFLYLSAYHLNESTMAEYVGLINRSGAKVLRGYPSSLYIFCRYLIKTKQTLPNVDTVVTSSEMLLPQYRETIEAALKTKVLDWYGCNERVVTVSQCPVNDGYHTNSEYGILEVVDDRGAPLIKGTGQVTGTNLHNLVMPLIRYQPGDVALRQAPEVCSCGRALPLELLRIEGRSDEILELGGVGIPPINFYTLFHGITGINQFQLVQIEKNRLVVKLVTDASYSPESKRAVEQGLRERVGAKVKLTLELVRSIERDRTTGKIRAIVNQVK